MFDGCAVGGNAAVDGEAVAGGEGGLKEGKALDAIPLGVGEKAMGVCGFWLLLKHMSKAD